MPGDVLRFRVFPEAARGLYAYVTVFDLWKDFHWWSREKWELHPERAKNATGETVSTRGRCVPYERGNGTRIYPDFAEVILCRKALGSGLISHEIAHCTHAWARRIGLLVDGDGDCEKRMEREERWCYAHGEMMRQTVDRLYRAGIIPE